MAQAMLAHVYKEKSGYFPAFVQPKLNGVRCLATRVSEIEIVYESRNGKPFHTLDFLTPYLSKLMEVGDTFDGELYIPETSFQVIVSYVKRYQEHSKALQYWVYDIVQDEAYVNRLQNLKRRFHGTDTDLGQYFGPVMFVDTKIALTSAQYDTLHADIFSAGYEGTILRIMETGYEQGKRSWGLLKRKDFQDAEFEIVGAFEGAGKDVGCVIFTCKSDTGVEFNVRPEGSYERREAWYDAREKLIGKMLSVRFQNLSDSGVPIFPIGIDIRDYE